MTGSRQDQQPQTKKAKERKNDTNNHTEKPEHWRAAKKIV
jgi:hypothetical protein